MPVHVDLNCDMGESFGAWRMGDDEALLDVVTSANLACGYHAGDPVTMDATIRAAARRGVAVGAHPSYPDLAGFGRRAMRVAAPELEKLVLYQIGAVAAMARAAGLRLSHVKPHGALYNDAAKDEELAAAIARAVAALDERLVVVGLSRSALVRCARELGLAAAEEGFCDRAYEADGSLRSRALVGALLEDPRAAADQALDIVLREEVRTRDGSLLRVRAQTLCIHGDTPGAVAIARAVRDALESAGVIVQPLSGGGERK